nr:MAG: hypothetical protein DIU70_07220 [Bacillota bacterium]
MLYYHVGDRVVAMQRGILETAVAGFLLGLAVGFLTSGSTSPGWWALALLAGGWLAWHLARGWGWREAAREAVVLPLRGGGGPQWGGGRRQPPPGAEERAPASRGQPPAAGEQPPAAGEQPPAAGEQPPAAGQPPAAAGQPAPATAEPVDAGEPGAPQGGRPAHRPPGKGLNVRAVTYQDGFPPKPHKVRVRLSGRGFPGTGRGLPGTGRGMPGAGR